jgi:hypothetical protein
MQLVLHAVTTTGKLQNNVLKMEVNIRSKESPEVIDVLSHIPMARNLVKIQMNVKEIVLFLIHKILMEFVKRMTAKLDVGQLLNNLSSFLPFFVEIDEMINLRNYLH